MFQRELNDHVSTILEFIVKWKDEQIAKTCEEKHCSIQDLLDRGYGFAEYNHLKGHTYLWGYIVDDQFTAIANTTILARNEY
jgi:hypothetical protein